MSHIFILYHAMTSELLEKIAQALAENDLDSCDESSNSTFWIAHLDALIEGI